MARGAGELLVIVAGVLIALWIEGWRESQIDAESARTYTARLEADLVADSARLAARHAAESRAIRLAEAALAFSEGGWNGTQDTVEILSAYHFAGFVNFLVPQSTTWDDLVSTGNLRLLDPSLREALGAYYKFPGLLLLSEMDDNRKELLWYRYRPRLNSYFPARYLNRLTDRRELRPFPSIDFDGLRSDPEIVSGLKSAVGMAEVYSRSLTDMANENAAALAVVRETGS